MAITITFYIVIIADDLLSSTKYIIHTQPKQDSEIWRTITGYNSC